jgi:hypothetical protein
MTRILGIRQMMLTFWLCLWVSSVPAQESTSRQAKILVVLPPDSQPLQVKIYTRWDHAFATLYPGTLQTSINDAIAARRSDPLAAEFNKTVADFQRTHVLSEALRRSFARGARGTDIFALTFSQDRSRYFGGDSASKLRDIAGNESFDFVLLINEKFLGLATMSTAEPNLISPALHTDFALYDARTRKEIEYGVASMQSPRGLPTGDFVRNRAQFDATWPSLCGSIASAIVDDLSKNDHLHVMAASVSRGDEIPAVEAVLKQYAKLFRWNMRPAKGWNTLFYFQPFTRGIAPKEPALRASMELRFEMEPLAQALGTGGNTVEQFLPLLFQKWQTNRPDCTPFERFADVNVPGYEAVTTSTPSGEKYILLLRRLEESFIQVVILSFVKDFDTLYPAHRADLEKMVIDSAPRLVSPER